MEVNNKSFNKKFAKIINNIKQCDYYSIDTEFSGNTFHMRDKEHVYDTMEDRYQKLKFACQNFLAWQLGLSLFKYNTLSKTYSCWTYTFQIFPYTNKHSYMMSSSAIRFLVLHGFPFNKIFEDGISFYQLAKKEEMKGCFTRPSSDQKLAPGRITQQELLELENDASDWITSDDEVFSISFKTKFSRDCFFKSDFFKVITSAGVTISKKGDLSYTLQKRSRLAREELNNGLLSRNRHEISYREEMGLSLVILALIHSKKPIVGHNLIYDLLFIYQQFIDDLPNNYQLFKKRLHNCFPRIYDTKVIAYANCGSYTNFDLESVMKRSVDLSRNKIKFEFPDDFRNLETVNEGHDAGFDSFCTGKAFTIMTKLVELRLVKPNKDRKKPNESLAKKDATIKVAKEKDEVERHRNETKEDSKVKIMKMMVGFKHGPASLDS